jgi:ubiquinone/menaquinone biosynthesis C-methylase UbiE
LGHEEKSRAVYHDWYLQRYHFGTKDALRDFLSSKRRILDAGTGVGRDTRLYADLAASGAEVFGVDLSRAIDSAYSHLKDYPNVHLVNADLTQLPFPRLFFDFIACDQVLHHTRNTAESFNRLVEFLAPGGDLSIYVYRKKAAMREMADDYLREASARMSEAEVWDLSEQLTLLGRALSELEAQVTVPDVPALGIKAGTYDVQRFIYWNFLKCYWNENLGYDDSVMTNFDWYRPHYAHRHTAEEVLRWYADAGPRGSLRSTSARLGSASADANHNRRWITMIELKDLIVCAVCRAELPLEETEQSGSGPCPECGQRYTYKNGVYNLTPQAPPDEMPRDKVAVWETLQANGLVSYTTAPEFNLSIGVRQDALQFKSFCSLSGLILDIGCGTQHLPSYLPEDGAVVGLDPFLGQQPRGFAFVQGLGEYLPFRDGTFDHILFATSLDHMINPRRSLAEAQRCLKPQGYLNLWLDAQAESHDAPATSSWERYQLVVKKGVRSPVAWWLDREARMVAHALIYQCRGAHESSRWRGGLLSPGSPDAGRGQGLVGRTGLRIVREEVFPASDGLFIQAQR